ncbi:MAG: hypothetical protein IRZ21_06070 [Thermoleophilaceae bacterium]|nr:hypothetical protein [Thermoleophilaceae bacterium]
MDPIGRIEPRLPEAPPVERIRREVEERRERGEPERRRRRGRPEQRRDPGGGGPDRGEGHVDVLA